MPIIFKKDFKFIIELLLYGTKEQTKPKGNRKIERVQRRAEINIKEEKHT